MKKKLALLLVLMMVLLGSAASAAVQPGDDFYYLDTADVLSTEAEGTIYFCNQMLEEACGAQMVIAALDNIGGEDTYDYAYELLNEWEVGSADENNGLLLLMAIEEGDYAVATGGGVDGVFSASVLQEYFDKYLEPEFARQNYEAGALKFFEAVLDKYIDRYNLDFSLAEGEKKAQSALAQGSTDGFGGARGGGGNSAPEYGYYEEEEDDISSFVIVLIVIVLIIVFSGSNNRHRGRPFFGPVVHIRTPRHHHHAPHHHNMHHAPSGSSFTGRAPRSGGFSGGASRSSGFGGARRSSGGFSGSFGGARGGGGRSFGGGARRGRH